MLATLPDTLEVRLDLAVELETLAARAALEWFLDNIAPELLLSALVL
jgi:hypothetical protein